MIEEENLTQIPTAQELEKAPSKPEEEVAKLEENQGEEKLPPANSQELEEASFQLLSNGMLRIPVAKKGKFQHARYGTVEFTEKDFTEIIDNFNQDVLGFEPYTTFGHLTDPTLSVDAELKKGKAKGFEIKDDVLYALTEPSTDTFDLVSKGEYEYCSGEFVRNYHDKESGTNRGTVLMRYALTNSPFLPFKDKKIEIIETLSQKSDSCTHDIANFMFKLSVEGGEINDPLTTKLEIMEQEVTKEVLEVTPKQEAEEASQESLQEKLTPVEDTLMETTSTEVKETAPQIEKAPVEVAAPAINVEAIIKQVLEQTQLVYQAQIEAVKAQAEATVASLKAEIASLNQTLQTQSATVQAFSTSMNASQKRARYQAIASQGVSSALIERLSVIESALEGGQQVIKLSAGAGEEAKEEAITEAIALLLIDACNTAPVQIEQYGQSISAIAANGLSADVDRLVAANREKATKLALK